MVWAMEVPAMADVSSCAVCEVGRGVLSCSVEKDFSLRIAHDSHGASRSSSPCRPFACDSCLTKKRCTQ